MLISKATTKDINSLVSIENDSFNKDNFALSKSNFYYHVKRSQIFVAKQNGVVCGYILLLFRSNSVKARIYSIAVSKDFQNMGVATALMEYSFLHAKKNSKLFITLEVSEDNRKAINLYKKLGFRCESILKNYYKDGSSAYKMVNLIGK